MSVFDALRPTGCARAVVPHGPYAGYTLCAYHTPRGILYTYRGDMLHAEISVVGWPEFFWKIWKPT